LVKEDGTFEELSKNGVLFQKLMENAGKMEEQEEEKEDGKNYDQKSSEPASSGVENEFQKMQSIKRKGKEGNLCLLNRKNERQVLLAGMFW